MAAFNWASADWHKTQIKEDQSGKICADLCPIKKSADFADYKKGKML
jgi:hypothetical protein